jgi:hypothetical protein
MTLALDLDANQQAKVKTLFLEEAKYRAATKPPCARSAGFFYIGLKVLPFPIPI